MYLYVCLDVVKDDETRFYLSFLLSLVFGYLFNYFVKTKLHFVECVSTLVYVFMCVVCCLLVVVG